MERIDNSAGAKILYDVKFCGNLNEGSLTYSFYGIAVPKDDEDEHSNMFKKVDESLKNKKRILFTMHGINTIPFNQISASDTFNERNDTDYFAIPIMWKNEKIPLKFCKNKIENAENIAKQLSDLWPRLEEIKDRNGMPMSLMAHSLGNQVLSIFAKSRSYDAYMNQGTVYSNHMFKDIYMVAPAVRWNIFDNETSDPIKIYTASLSSQNSTNEEKENQGNVISLLADKVHVLWNNKDNAGLAYKLLVVVGRLTPGWLTIASCNRNKGLLNSGDQAKNKIHPDLEGKVDFIVSKVLFMILFFFIVTNGTRNPFLISLQTALNSELCYFTLLKY